FLCSIWKIRNLSKSFMLIWIPWTLILFSLKKMELKNKIRLLYKSKRLGLDREQRALLSEKINSNVIQYLSGKAGIEHIHIFLPIDKLNEVDTFPLIKALQDQGKTIYTSTSDFKKGIMQTVKLVADPLFGPD